MKINVNKDKSVTVENAEALHGAKIVVTEENGQTIISFQSEEFERLQTKSEKMKEYQRNYQKKYWQDVKKPKYVSMKQEQPVEQVPVPEMKVEEPVQESSLVSDFCSPESFRNYILSNKQRYRFTILEVKRYLSNHNINFCTSEELISFYNDCVDLRIYFEKLYRRKNSKKHTKTYYYKHWDKVNKKNKKYYRDNIKRLTEYHKQYRERIKQQTQNGN